MKICLIRCPAPFLIDDKVFPPLGLLSVATALKQAGHEIHVHDGAMEDVPAGFDGYGLGPTTPEYASARIIKDSIRKQNPSARIVIGGPYATLNVSTCLADGFDCVVTGDGEPVVADAFVNNTAAIRSGGQDRPLDDYPIVDRSLINIKDYKYMMNDRPATSMVSSQGCPYHCAFCCKNYTSVRMHSVARVIEEIGIIHDNFGFGAILFPEDLFIIKPSRVEAIGRHLRYRGIIWRCLVRGDLIVRYGREFVDMMKSCGCVEVGMGVESGSDTILRNVNKKETAAEMKEAIRMLKSSGLRVKGFFIVGLPGESPKTLKETCRFLEETGLDDVDIKIFQPYPGTPIWEHREDYDISWHNSLDYGKMFYKGRPREYYGSVSTRSMTTDQIYNAWVDMEAVYKHV